MERRTGIIIVTAIGVILIGIGVVAFLAWRKSHAILEDFQRVNHELDSTRLTLNDEQARTRALFDSFVCPEMVQKADAMHAESESVSLLIDEFKDDLALFAMDDTGGSDSLFGAEERGLRLYRALLRYFDLAQLVCADDSLDRQIDNYADFMRDYPDATEWRKRNFDGVPAAACQAILSKVKSEVSSTEALVLNDLLARCNPANEK